ncbi:dihydropteroate synthase [Agrococcus jejuensis]|uniref:7,8-dihydroneopterin aldolase n=1 Tax=Agrococcus jejuensis TaxID=399736 RepID=A0A1G8C2Y0_9MICO|nr:dihydropteroate synthase [Agrococcus jejuensis]SDH39300.1 dihydroneopterin aldolase/dihydropteroate synthase,TIGR01496 [Agrococcus jejuensis]
MTRILGVLNVTPDSFSDGGRFEDAGAAIAHARRLRLQGADVVDVGGESTRPGATPVAVEAELARILPVVQALSSGGIAVSIDTMHADTARAAVEAGATIVNDVSGGLADARMASVVADLGVTYVLTHWRGHDLALGTTYGDVVADVRDELSARVDAVVAAGIDPARIVLDPGLGFSKDADDNWRLIAGLDRIVDLGLPVLVGASRKRFLGALLPADAPMDARDHGTAALSVLAAQAGAWGVRVHDVVSTRRVLDVLDAVGAVERRPAPVVGVADRIELRGLEAFAHHGVFEHERRDGQRFVIDLDVEVDLATAARGDELARTVHYGELAEAVVAAVERDPVDLIETVAERVAAVALGFAAAQRVRVTVHKPSAPIAVPFGDVAVTIERGRA